jgi:hypothetical protein
VANSRVTTLPGHPEILLAGQERTGFVLLAADGYSIFADPRQTIATQYASLKVHKNLHSYKSIYGS